MINGITWHIGNQGFDMELSGKVPSTIATQLPQKLADILNSHKQTDIWYWAIHPGGRSVLDAVQDSIGLDDSMMSSSRDILRRYGNMPSATIMFVLHDILQQKETEGLGCAMAFGPGVMVESMVFQKALA